MAFRALLFSKAPETNAAVAEACKSLGLRLETCADIFSAIEKGTKEPFSCVIADWFDQPEAGFLVKRTRESAAKTKLIAIAIVDRDPSANEMRDHGLDYLLHRPVDLTETQDVLAKAREDMSEVDATRQERRRPAVVEDPMETPVSSAAEPVTQPANTSAGPNQAVASEDGEDAEAIENEEAPEPTGSGSHFPFAMMCAVLLLMTAAYFMWNARGSLLYLARTPENKFAVLHEAVSAYLNPPVALSIEYPASQPRQDPSFRGANANTDTHVQVGVVSAESDVLISEPRQPWDFPLPTPIYEATVAAPVRAARPAVPDSLRGSAPMTRPAVVTINPAQMMQVSVPPTPSASSDQFSEPVAVTEEAERALLIHSVDPVYPADASAQKLRGPVVLQATIGRDGSVEDLKIVRGSFVLSRAAIAAVKQWKFQPYMVHGRPAETQTQLTVNVNPPPG